MSTFILYKILHTRWLLRLILVSCIVLSGLLVADAEVRAPKLGSILSRNHPTWQALEQWQQELADMTHSRLVVNLFPEGQLGTVEDIVYGLRFGHIEMGVLPLDVLIPLSPSLSAVSLPYVFDDDGHRARVLDGPVGKQLLKSLQHANIIGLEFFEAAPRGIFSPQNTLNVPADFQKLTIGSALGACGSEDFLAGLSRVSHMTLAAFGANLTSVCPEQAKEALDSGMIDGWEGMLSDWEYFSGAGESMLIFMATNHMTTPDVLVVSKRWFDSLPTEDQIVIRKVLRFAVVQQRTLWLLWIEQMMIQIQEAGIQIQTVERTPFEHAVQPVYSTLSEWNEALAKAIQAIDQVK